MPGVPSGRGCNGCRKQKKKCDQGQPACSRCSRLQIDCVGSGQRRFKFVEEQPALRISPEQDSSMSLCQISRRKSTQHINLMPSNTESMITGAFLAAIDIKDIRFDLSTYGDFLHGIPQRLGTNSALDASVKAFTVSFPIVHSRRQTAEAYESYIKAIQALRECLDDPKQAMSANTMCAVYLIMICQGWIGQRDDCMGHGEALVALLSSVPPDCFKDVFENDLMMTLCVPVIIESIGNPRIKLYPWLPLLTKARDDAVVMESLRLRNLARLPDMIRDPILHSFEIKSAYQRMTGVDIPKLRAYLDDMKMTMDQWTEARKPKMEAKKLQVRLLAAFGLLLSFASILNALLRALEPNNLYLVQEGALMADEMISVADGATQYRPLGSSAMPLCLATAWATSNDVSTRTRAEQVLEVYQPDFAMSKWLDIAYWLKLKLADHGIAIDEASNEVAAMLDQSCVLM